MSAIYKAKTALLGGLDAKLLAQVQRIPAYVAKVQAKDPEALVISEPNATMQLPTHFERCFIASGAA